MRYWVFAEAPATSPVESPAQVRGWVHWHDEDGGSWGCRFRAEVTHAPRKKALGWLEFFSDEAPKLARNQRLELYAGREEILIVDVIDLDSTPSSRAASTPD